MPIVRIDGRVVYYCHVPRAAGTAMEAYLRAQFGPLALADEQFYAMDESQRWTRTSPQHVDVHSLGRLFPPGFFDAAFAVVRDPVARIVSAYKFQKLVEGLIAPKTFFDEWVLGLDRAAIERPFAFDNHLLPMHHLVPEGARIFRLEDGFGPVIAYLRDLAGPGARLPDTVAPLNVLSTRLRWMKAEDEIVVVGDVARRHIAELYRGDFERFGYAAPVPVAIESTDPWADDDEADSDFWPGGCEASG